MSCSSSDIFAITPRTETSPGFISDFVADFAIKTNTDSVGNIEAHSRLTQKKVLYTDSTSEEAEDDHSLFDYMNGFNDVSSANATVFSWMWKRAFSHHDVVAYTGDGEAGRTVPHNLGVVPELIFVKIRTQAYDWYVYNKTIGNHYYIFLNEDSMASDDATRWNDTTPGVDEFTVGSANQTNGDGETFIAYLFASLQGISKVGSYTGNGSNITIDAGFSTGCKFLIVKRTDDTGNWVMVDSVRGLDNFLILNDTDEEASDSGITTDTTGFSVEQNGTTDLNVSDGEYIYYAIAN